MSRSDTAAEGGEEFGASSAQQGMSAPAIGKVQTVMGLVTITRANDIVDQPAVGDFVYKGDLIETGVGGLIAIAFVDGTEFHFATMRALCWTNLITVRINLLNQRSFAF